MVPGRHARDESPEETGRAMRSFYRCIVLGLALGAVLPFLCLAQGPGGEKTKGEKLLTFEMRDKPWSAVLEWLTDQTGLPFASVIKPTGTFNVITPKNQKYTLPEV